MLKPIALALALTAPAVAQDAEAPSSAAEIPELASHAVIRKLALPGGELEYTAQVADYAIRDDEGTVTAHFTAFSYVKRGGDQAARPVTFAFNGGPGSSSVWLHMGLLGPKLVQVPSDAENAGAPPYPLVDNPHSLLSHTDLVFVDPVGTGYSKAVGESSNEDFWGVDEDALSVAHFVQEWLSRHDRWASPKYVLGESYGGVRGALLARVLKQARASVAINGLVFVSPAFDIQFVDGREDDLTYVTSLPTYAATAEYHGVVDLAGRDRLEWLAEVSDYASGPYLTALFAGEGLDDAQRDAVAAQLAAYTGLSEAYWQRANLRVSASRFRKELLRDRGHAVGRLDTRYRGAEHDGVAEEPSSDPMIAGIGSAYVAGFQSYTRGQLGLDWPERTYNFSGSGTFGKWKRSAEGQGAFAGWLDTVPDLATAMAENPELRVFVANGWYDIATTVLAAEYNLSRPGIDASRVTVRNYGAGHMMYVHQPSLERMAADLRAFYAPTR